MLIWHIRRFLFVTFFPVVNWCQWSFWDPLLSKGSGHSLEAHRNSPASSETLLSPYNSGHHALNITLESSLHMGKTHPPWGSEFTGIFLLGILLTWHKSRSLLCPVHHQVEVSGGKSWMAHWAWSSPGYWMQCMRFSISLKASSKIP